MLLALASLGSCQSQSGANKSRCDGETAEECGADETADYRGTFDQNTLIDRIYK